MNLRTYHISSLNNLQRYLQLKKNLSCESGKVVAIMFFFIHKRIAFPLLHDEPSQMCHHRINVNLDILILL